MEKWVIDKAFEEFGFEEALDVLFAAAICEVESMVDDRIYFDNVLSCIRDGFVPIDTGFKYRIRWSKPNGVFDSSLL